MEQMSLELPPTKHVREVVYCEHCRHGTTERGGVLCLKGGAHLKRRGFFCADGELEVRGK